MSGDIVAHLVRTAGRASEGWIDDQITRTRRWRSTLLAAAEADPYLWKRRPDVSLRGRRSALVTSQLTRAPRAVSRALPRAFGAPLQDASVCHTHFAHVSVGLAPLLERFDLPQVLTPYGFDVSRSRYTSGTWARRYAQHLPRAAAAIVEGPAMGRRLADLGMPGDRIHVVRLPVDLDAVASPGPPLSSPVGYVGMAAGRLVDKKGFDIAIRAFERAWPRGDQRLLIIGSGPAEHELRRVVSDATRVADRIDFMPFLPLPQLVQAFIDVRLVLFPSRTARDGDGEGGAPVTLTWAQAAGARAVVSDHDDLPFAAGPGSIVVPTDDVGAFAEAWRSLVDGDEPRELSDANTAFVRSAYDPDMLAEMRERVYDLALG